ncbi:selenocysteine-specific translation elongation factor, partial [Candidatus Sumerlaeota bacterium]|nr:selenocysteine-specific translation elongation factor [Candidatus Sumerlaeota bacterium]
MSETIGRALILGTAGHIDHGKTALVKALTGIDADRLPEEQQRGMTIDLGFAHLELGGKKIGIVDVPGHERFIRNMVAGATGIDLVMLLVAADDSVMPQTREHLEIIDLLGVRGGLVALSKIDLASEEKILSAEAGVRELTRGTCLEGCPIIRVSAITGEGIAMLRDAIEQQIQNLDLDSWPPLFRLPIDRRFSLKGHGTVVTGSLLGGDVAPSDEVELMPQGRKVRVRSAQSHGSQRQGLESGRRVALNVAGLRTRDVKRGDELAAPGFLRPSSRLLVRLRCLRSAPLVIDSHQTFRLHIGTQNVDGQFALIGVEELEPGQSVYGLLRTKAEVCAVHGQRFIVRSSSHGVTIGGGEVLCTNPPRLKLSEGEPAWIDTLHDGSERDRLLTMLEIEPSLGGDLRGLYRET